MRNEIATPSIKKNFTLNTIYQLLLIIVPLITTPFVSRTMGADGVGIYSYTYSNVSYFLLVATLGSRTYGAREIAYLQNDIEKRSKLFCEVMILRLITSAAAIIAYFLYIYFFVSVDIKIAALQSIYLFASAIDIIWLFQGMEDFSKVAVRSTVIKICSMILVFIFVRNSDDVDIYTLILAGTTVISNLILWKYLPQYIRKPDWHRLKVWKHFKEEIQLFLPTIAIQVYTVLDKTMIRAFATNSVENGYYEQTEKIVRVAITILTSLSVVMAPRIAKLFAEKNLEQLSQYMKKTFRVTWMMSIPALFGIAGVSSTFVPVFFGEGFNKVEFLMPLYSTIIVFVPLSQILGIQFLIAIGKQKMYTIAVTFSAIINLAFNSILIPKYASFGATVATIVAEATGAFIMVLYCKKNNLLRTVDIFGGTTSYWIAGGIIGIIVRLEGVAMGVSIVTLLIQVITGVIAYVTILALMKDELLLSYTKKYTNIVINRIKNDKK